MNKFLAPLLMALLISAGSEAQHTYQKEIQQWDSVRYAFLISDTGWVNLAGLLWLAEGRNSFGTDPSNDIVFPPGTIAGKAGYIELHNGSVTLIPNPNANVLVDGKKKDSAIIYQKDWTTLPVCSSGNM